MNPDSWERAAELFDTALSLAPKERAAFLDEACSRQDALRERVEELLANHEEAEANGFLERATEVESMELAPGTELGRYKLVRLIGAGGMGQVYQATDTRLDRTVAIKVLPSDVASNPDVRVRFEREARTISQLNHPHICTLYDVGQENDVDFLVMEYIEGETLAERLEKGALPLELALQHGIEIADALDKAHRHGIVHRDLKPGNVMLTKSGAKLLDFGLAKLAPEPSKLDPDAATATKMTREGTIVGTLQYMAPEQVEGKKADARTDIFAFGSVLYEMVTGRRAFKGESQASLIAAILEREPPTISAAPPLLDHVIRRCLAKEPDRRWQTASDLMQDLRWISGEGSSPAVLPTGQTQSRLVPGIAVGVLGTLLVGLVVWALVLPEPVAPPPAPAQFTVATPPEGSLRLTGSQTDVAFSPDGMRIVYMTSTGSHESRHLYVRELDQLVATPLLGSERARSPFFSPDGEWVGFEVSGGRDNNKLKKVSVLGGRSVTICQWTSSLRGVSWGPDDTIVFSTSASKGLLRVAAAGGQPDELTTVDTEQGEVNHTWPEFLPGGDAILFNILTPESNRIAVLSLENGDPKVVIENGSNPHYVPTGHVVYGVDGRLWAVPFDLDRLAVTADPVPVLEGVITKASGAVNFSFSGDGSLVYVSGTTGSTTRSVLVLVDRSGREAPVTEITADYLFPRFSPDGRHLAFSVAETEGSISDWQLDVDVWTIEVERGSRTRVTLEGNNLFPTWSPDGSRVAFSVSKPGRTDLYMAPVDGSGFLEALLVRDGYQSATSWTSDGRAIAYTEAGPDTGANLWVLSLEGDPASSPFLVGPFDERAGTFSPDGRFMAYVSDESGQDEVYVRPHPGPGGEVIVSTGGGTEPIWARDGTELFYRKGEQMLVAEVETEGTFSARTATVLFEGKYEASRSDARRGHTNYDVSPDGQQFVMVRRTGESKRVAPQIHVILNWFEELERLVPTK